MEPKAAVASRETMKILVPVDFSPSSKRALRYALDFAPRLSATIEGIYVWEPPRAFGADVMLWSEKPGVSLIDHARSTARARFDELFDELGLSGERVPPVHIASGHPGDVIAHYAKEHGFDMIVMGTRGVGAFEKLLLGSVAQRVVRAAPCPVLTVRGPEDD